MQNKKRIKTNLFLFITIVLILALLAGGVAWMQNREDNSAASGASSGASLPIAAQNSAPASTALPPAKQPTPVTPASSELPEEMRAMWISFLEWEKADISTEAALRRTAGQMFDHCADMGLNTVIVSVRSFSDALYKSEVYPFSHLLTGTQGADPGYDPLAVLVEEAHSRSLRIEAWINPYRIKGSANGPDTLSADNPATLHPDWVREASGLWFDPGLPEVRQLVTSGVTEIVRNYDVDGIHFDDYFYPEFNAEQKETGLDTAFDAETFDTYGKGDALGAWRRDNVNTLVRNVYAAVKAEKPNVSFGISPQGNNENNYQMQYSDIKLWMAQPGYVDYVMPQLYWGFGYETSSGRTQYAFGNISAEWAGYERNAAVRLYAGLGAYRIGTGDGGANDQAEWSTGHNLADMLQTLHDTPGFSGFALFRYAFLFQNEDPLGAQEVAALKASLAPAPAPAP